MWQFCNSERAGSHINRVKTFERISLQRDTFSSLVFGTFNNMAVQALGTSRLLSKWRSDGHMSDTTSGSTEDGQSKVIKRHLARNQVIAFFTQQKRGSSWVHSRKQACVRPARQAELKERGVERGENEKRKQKGRRGKGRGGGEKKKKKRGGWCGTKVAALSALFFGSGLFSSTAGEYY